MTIQDSASQHSARHELSSAESRLLEQISLDQPWSLVERFSTMHRWRPEDVNTAADVIAGRLAKLGVPVEVHEPEIYLSIPLSAQVEAGGTTFRAKPPSSCLPAPGRGSAANWSTCTPTRRRCAATTATSRPCSAAASPRSRRRAASASAGSIVVMQGFGNPALTSLIEEWGGVGLIAVNPGVDIHWGTCTTIWGSPDLHDLPRKPRSPSSPSTIRTARS